MDIDNLQKDAVSEGRGFNIPRLNLQFLHAQQQNDIHLPVIVPPLHQMVHDPPGYALDLAPPVIMLGREEKRRESCCYCCNIS